MTPVQKQQNPISKHRYFQAPKGFFGYFKHQLAGGQNPSPQTKPWGNLLKLSAPRCNSLTPILVTATSQWTEQLAGNAAADRLLQERDTDTDGDGVCYTFKEIHISVASRQFPLFAEQFPGKRQLQKPLGSSTSTSLVTQNVPLS